MSGAVVWEIRWAGVGRLVEGCGCAPMRTRIEWVGKGERVE